MGKEATRVLRAELGAAPPKGLGVLEDDELRALADALREARRRQSAALEAAAGQALGHVPRLIRGPVRKILGG